MPDSSSLSPQAIERRRRMAQALRAQGMSQQDIQHPMQGIAQLAQGYVGGQQMRDLDRAEREGREGANQMIANLLKTAPEGESASERNRRIAAELQGNPWTEGIGEQLAMQELTRGPEELVSVVGDEGPMYVPQSQAAGMQPYSGSTSSKPPASIAEYNLARSQGYQGTFEDWENERSRGQVIEFEGARYIFNPVTKEYTPLSTREGEISASVQEELETSEAGRGRVMNPEGEFQAVPGTEAAREEEAAQEFEEARRESELQTANLITQDIDRALEKINSGVLPDTGPGAALRFIPGTEARDVAGLLDTVKANIGFEQLQRMREASPTGGALGQVTEREIAFLQALEGNIEQSQSKQQLTENLNRLWNATQDVIHGEGKGPERRPLSFQSGQTGLPEGVTEEDIEFTMQKHGLTREQVLERLNAP